MINHRYTDSDTQLKPIKLNNLNESPKNLFQDIKNTPSSHENFKLKDQENTIKFRKHLSSKKGEIGVNSTSENDENSEQV